MQAFVAPYKFFCLGVKATQVPAKCAVGTFRSIRCGDKTSLSIYTDVYFENECVNEGAETCCQYERIGDVRSTKRPQRRPRMLVPRYNLSEGYRPTLGIF